MMCMDARMPRAQGCAGAVARTPLIRKHWHEGGCVRERNAMKTAGERRDRTRFQTEINPTESKVSENPEKPRENRQDFL